MRHRSYCRTLGGETKQRIRILPFLLVVSTGMGCGSKESETPKAEEAVSGKIALDGHAKVDTDIKDHRNREKSTHRDDAAQEKGGRRKRNAQLRGWTKQHLYVRLALEKLNLPEAQLTRLSDMNWAHFIALEKQKLTRPSLDDALRNMVETGGVNDAAFDADRIWREANQAMQERQYKERMTALHETLDESQRKKLVALVEAEQKKQYQAEDKRVATSGDAGGPLGCGTRGARLLDRFVDDRDLTRAQQRKRDAIRQALDQDRLSEAELADLRQARRIYDMAVRKGFVKSHFDIAKLIRPKADAAAPLVVSECYKKSFKAYLDILTEADRKAALNRFEQRQARRRGGDVDAGDR